MCLALVAKEIEKLPNETDTQMSAFEQDVIMSLYFVTV